MARPKLNIEDKRTEQVNIRLTFNENEIVIKYSSASGISPANWMREKVFAGKFPAMKLSPLDASIYQELKKIGVNLNQATHKLNQGDMPIDFLIRQYELQTILQRILSLLINDRESNKR